MRKKTKTRRKFGRICALVLVGMFIVMTSMPISANDPDDWTKGGDSFSGTGSIQILGTLSSDSVSIIAGGKQGIIVSGSGDTPGLVGIGLAYPSLPVNRLDVAGGMAVGEDFAGNYSAPSDGMIIEGWVGIGTTDPRYPLEVMGDVWLNSDTIKMGVGTFYIKVQKDAKLSTDDYRIIIDENDNQNDRYFSVEKDEGKNDARGSGTELMRVQENGNVGIATQNPTQKLHVDGNVRIEEHIFDSNNDQGTANYILRTTATGIDWVDPLDFAVADADWDYGTNPPHMYSLPTGNVGIGETSPSSKLEVNGGVELTNLYDNDATNFFEGGATASETVTGITSTGQIQTTSISIDESQVSGEIESVTAGDGLTGGGTSGDVTLDVGAGDDIIVNANDVALANDIDVDNILAATTSGLSIMDSSSNLGIFIEQGGEVGIGTAIPDHTLHVAGDAYITGALYDYHDLAGSDGQILKSTGSKIEWVDSSSVPDGDWTISGNNMYSTVSGNVGIGYIDPYQKLVVNGKVGIGYNDASQTADLAVYGNVGIGTTVPNYDLDIGDGTGSRTLRVRSGGGGTTAKAIIGYLDISSSGNTADVTISNTYGGSTTGYGDIILSAASTGNVGIGETSPSSKLEVNGNVELTNLYDNDGSNFFDSGATASQTITGITSTGALETTSISISESQVSGEIESVTAGSGLTGGGTSGGVTLNVGAGDGIDVFTDTVAVDVTDILGTGLRENNNNIGVYGLMASDGSSTNVVYVDNQGKVGIGTTGPWAKLDVRGSAFFNYGQGNHDFRILGNTEQWLFLSDADLNRIGIGTSYPDARLEVVGSGTNSSTMGLIVRDNQGTGVLFVRDDGRVGICDCIPEYELSIGKIIGVGGYDPQIHISGSTNPGNPGAGSVVIYFDGTDLKAKNSSGTVKTIADF